VERRLLADRIDFEKFTDFDIMVTDPNFDCRNVGKLIVSEMTARYNEYVYYS